jgi:ribosomal protein S21
MKKQTQENSDQLLRRFMRGLQEENKITDMKEKMFFTKKPNQLKRKSNTLRHLQLVAKKQKEMRGY